MRIAVFGTGGVGGYFGARLAQAGEEVVLIARGEHLRAMREHGLRVESLDETFTVAPAAVVSDPAEAGPVDCVLVAVKAWQVEEVGRALAPMLGPDTFVVPLQNGVEAPAQLAEALGGRQRVLGGLCALLAHRVEPGVIRHAGVEPRVVFGELDNRRSQRAQRLLEAFERAKGVEAKIADDIHVAMWRKFLFIAGWGGAASAARAEVGVLRELPETRALLERCMREIEAVGRATGVALPEDAVDSALAMVDAMPAEATASMQRDIEAGLPSELDSQIGSIVRLGRRYDVATPCNDCLYAALLPQERRARRLRQGRP